MALAVAFLAGCQSNSRELVLAGCTVRPSEEPGKTCVGFTVVNVTHSRLWVANSPDAYTFSLGYEGDEGATIAAFHFDCLGSCYPEDGVVLEPGATRTYHGEFALDGTDLPERFDLTISVPLPYGIKGQVRQVDLVAKMGLMERSKVIAPVATVGRGQEGEIGVTRRW